MKNASRPRLLDEGKPVEGRVGERSVEGAAVNESYWVSVMEGRPVEEDEPLEG